MAAIQPKSFTSLLEDSDGVLAVQMRTNRLPHPVKREEDVCKVSIGIFDEAASQEAPSLLIFKSMIHPKDASILKEDEDTLKAKKQRLFELFFNAHNVKGYTSEIPWSQDQFDERFKEDADKAKKEELYTGYYIEENGKIIGRVALTRGYSEKQEALKGYYEASSCDAQMEILINGEDYTDKKFETICRATQLVVKIFRDAGYKLSSSGNLVNRLITTVIDPDSLSEAVEDRAIQASLASQIASLKKLGLEVMGKVPAHHSCNPSDKARLILGVNLPPMED